MPLSPGDRVHCEMAKWGDRPHWTYEGTYLGSDEHGEWLGFHPGTRFVRPGFDITAPNHQVGLVPAAGPAGERPWWLATFHEPDVPTWPVLEGTAVATYVDMTTPAVWQGHTLRAVDLDLDVVLGVDGTLLVDDEDEFADHQVRFGYPAEVVAGARASCAAVLAMVRAGQPPYDGSHRRWLATLLGS